VAGKKKGSSTSGSPRGGQPPEKKHATRETTSKAPRRFHYLTLEETRQALADAGAFGADGKLPPQVSPPRQSDALRVRLVRDRIDEGMTAFVREIAWKVLRDQYEAEHPEATARRLRSRRPRGVGRPPQVGLTAHGWLVSEVASAVVFHVGGGIASRPSRKPGFTTKLQFTTGTNRKKQPTGLNVRLALAVRKALLDKIDDARLRMVAPNGTDLRREVREELASLTPHAIRNLLRGRRERKRRPHE
jgi:hypothetical protein